MLDTVDFNHVQHISFTQSLLTDAVSVILSELLSYEHPPNVRVPFAMLSALHYQRNISVHATSNVILVRCKFCGLMLIAVGIEVI